MTILCALLLVLVAVNAAIGQAHPGAGTKPFDPKEYPSDKFRVSKKDYAFGDLTVRIINVKNEEWKNRGVATSVPRYCSAWVELLRGASSPVKRLFYDDIDPVGSNFGVLVPDRQTTNDYFLVVKLGDYDGRLLLISPTGDVDDIPGGLFFVTADKKYLVSEYESDLSEITVYDLAEHRVAIPPTEMPELGSWYRDETGYFVMEYGQHGSAERLDLGNRRIVEIAVSEVDRRKATKIPYDFDPRKKQDCVSTPAIVP
jgi:hypothetical protein